MKHFVKLFNKDGQAYRFLFQKFSRPSKATFVGHQIQNLITDGHFEKLSKGVEKVA